MLACEGKEEVHQKLHSLVMMLALPFDSIGIQQIGMWAGGKKKKNNRGWYFQKFSAGRVFIAESNESKFGFGVLVLLWFLFVWCSLFVCVLDGFLGCFVFGFFFYAAYLQTPEKKIRRHPNHRGAVEILLYLTFLRWEFWNIFGHAHFKHVVTELFSTMI